MTKKPTNIQQGLDDYNPFADPTSQQRAGTVIKILPYCKPKPTNR